jgi:hypothetical protein
MKTDIEYAALVMGGTAEYNVEQRLRVKGVAGPWNPLEDDGDSRRLEIACNKWINTNGAEADTICDAHWNYVDSWDECDPQAIRAAVFALAVAIGKVISAGDAIDGGEM